MAAAFHALNSSANESPTELSPRDLRRQQMFENLTGTYLLELFLVIGLVPLTNFTRCLANIFLFGPDRKVFASTSAVYKKLTLDFALVIIPYTLALLDVFSSCVPILIGLIAFSVGVAVTLFQHHAGPGAEHVPETPKPASLIRLTRSTDNLYYGYFNHSRLSCVSQLRGYTTFLTSFAILAVDFYAFPRRHAKTENYGYSLMDTGVMWYVFCNAAVDPACKLDNPVAAENKMPKTTGSAHNHAWKKTLVSVAAMVLLGIVRIAVVKSINYHEHVSEYGPLWNFFFTLAIVVLAARFVFSTLRMHVKYSLLLGIAMVVLYELLLLSTNELETLTRVRDVIFSDLDRSFPSMPKPAVIAMHTVLDFIVDNRAGIFSCFSYAAVYFVSTFISYRIHRISVKPGIRCCYDFICLALVCGLIGVALAAGSQAAAPFYVLPSRRLGNASYTAYNLGLLLWAMSVFFCSDLLGIMLREFCLLPFYQQARNPMQFIRKFVGEFMNYRLFADIRIPPGAAVYEEPCLMDALNRKMLPVFLCANVATGLVNIAIDTSSVSVRAGTLMLLCYSAALCIPPAFDYAKKWLKNVPRPTSGQSKIAAQKKLPEKARSEKTPLTERLS